MTFLDYLFQLAFAVGVTVAAFPEMRREDIRTDRRKRARDLRSNYQHRSH